MSKNKVFSSPFSLTFGLNTEIYEVNFIFSSDVEKYGPEKISVLGVFSHSVQNWIASFFD